MMNSLRRGWCVFILLLLLSACGQRDGLAPVVESRWQVVHSKPLRHVVVRGETLYAIAFRYNEDYRRLAIVNQLPSPYTLRVGQVLRVQPQRILATQPPPRARPTPTLAQPPYHPAAHALVTRSNPAANNGWVWPVYGRVVSTFMPNLGKKGIDIAGKKGEEIHAAAGGVVAYAGSGLSGYGNLIIIKHDNQFLTAYGNNARNLVREGQRIKAGQVIAKMGVVDRRFWGVHFEIRKSGLPVNPLNYLQKS